MLTYIVKRILQAIPIVLAATFIAYGIARAAPGDPVSLLVGDPSKIPPAVIESIKDRLGLNKPWYVAYVYWLRNLIYSPPGPPIIDIHIADEARREATGRTEINLRVDADTRIYLGDRQLSVPEFASATWETKVKKTGKHERIVKYEETHSPFADLIAEDPDATYRALFVWEKVDRLTGLFDEKSANRNELSKHHPRNRIRVVQADPASGRLTYELVSGAAGEQRSAELADANVQLWLADKAAVLGDFQPGQEYYLVTKELQYSKLYGLADQAGAAQLEALKSQPLQYRETSTSPFKSVDRSDPAFFDEAVELRSVVAEAGQYFDMGQSYNARRPVTELYTEALSNSFFLVLLVLILDFAIAIPVGVIVALKKNSLMDYFLTFLAFVSFSLPSFWMVLIAQMIFAYGLNWLPSGGMNSPNVEFSLSDWSTVVDRARHAVIPLTVLTMLGVASTMRYTRSAVLDVLHMDYVRTAKAKGLSYWKVVGRHVLKNAMIPIITLFGLTFPFLINGSFIVESLSSWPGAGKLALEAILQRDYPVVMAGILFGSIMIILGQLLSDIMYAWANPRIRKGFGG